MQIQTSTSVVKNNNNIIVSFIIIIIIIFLSFIINIRKFRAVFACKYLHSISSYYN